VIVEHNKYLHHTTQHIAKMSMRKLYVDGPLATTINMYDNKTLHDLACWIPGRQSRSAFEHVRDYATQLLDNGADVHTVYGLVGETALIATCRRGYHSFMEFLVSRGAYPNTRTTNGVRNTAVHFCVANADIYGIRILGLHHELRCLPNAKGYDPLTIAFSIPEEYRLDIIQCLINANMDVNRVGTQPGRDSILHHAIGPTPLNRNAVTTPASRAIVDLLLRHGADVCSTNHMDCRSCLHLVAELRDRKMLYELLSKAYEHNSGQLNPPRMPLLEDVGRRWLYTTEEYTEYVNIINDPSRTSLLFVVLRCIEMMKRSLTFALGVRRAGTSMRQIPPEMVRLMTSVNINQITDMITHTGLGPWKRRDIEEIAMTALGWMHDTPVEPVRFWWQ
jgi:ankyrin repeat protein